MTSLPSAYFETRPVSSGVSSERAWSENMTLLPIMPPERCERLSFNCIEYPLNEYRQPLPRHTDRTIWNPLCGNNGRKIYKILKNHMDGEKIYKSGFLRGLIRLVYVLKSSARLYRQWGVSAGDTVSPCVPTAV